MSTEQIEDPFQTALPTVHEAVRKSQLMLELFDKLSSPPSADFPFIERFSTLRNLIAPQISQTKVLFPEFTPHDEALHVGKLFQLADKFFGRHIYRNMNVSELFLLAAALYAHDWGMAVGNDEKEFLRNGAPDNLRTSNFVPIDDEPERLRTMAIREGLPFGCDGGFPLMPEHLVRLYVRETHAKRSAARIRSHFHDFPAVGEALACICEGHWLDFATLDDPRRFPRDYEVAGQTSNLLAIALQVRIIDLFHITDDRTPFALWRFVSPTDTRSAEEWKKHRALNGVTVTEFNPGRAIKVQGITEDETVWAGLQDLRRYCEDQIAGMLNVCARHVPVRYGLDFVKLEWAVPTGSLRPVDFRFGFDRTSMFRILSDDIYDGDRYVFLRELLQNAIDAIRTRRARHSQPTRAQGKKKQLSAFSFDTTIYFEATHQENGDTVVTCRDYGIGMDEHVLQNYFIVAGVSYYRSEEFQRQHLGFEPVSRFGIGILSCFMVADSLEVRTYRDPSCGPPMAHADSSLPGAGEYQARRLHLIIPSVERQFIVKNMTDDFEVGTEVTLKLLANKARFQREESTDTMPRRYRPTVANAWPDMPSKRVLNITEYLCAIAGFVEFPIHVTEIWPSQTHIKRTLILHPNKDSTSERALYEAPLEVWQLSRNYPWELVADAGHLSAIHNTLSLHTFELKELTELAGYEGWVSFPQPKDPHWDFRSTNMDEDHQSLVFCDLSTGSLIDHPIYWLHRNDYNSMPTACLGKGLISVYRDGILLHQVDCEDLFEIDSSPAFPPPVIRVNLPSTEPLVPNVARSNIVTATRSSIFTPIIDRLHSYLLDRELPNILRLSPKDRLFRIGWLTQVFRLDYKILTKSIPLMSSPIPFVEPDSTLVVKDNVFLQGNKIATFPPVNLTLWFESEVLGIKKTANPNWQWQGVSSLFLQQYGYKSYALDSACNWICDLIEENTCLHKIQFLQPPSGSNYLLPQHVLVVSTNELCNRLRAVKYRPALPKDLREQLVDVLSQIVRGGKALTPHNLKILSSSLYRYHRSNAALAAVFEKPFESKLMRVYHRTTNLLHPYTVIFLQCLALGMKNRIENTMTAPQSGLWDAMIASIGYYQMPHIKAMKLIVEFVVENRLATDFSIPDAFGDDVFVPKIASDAQTNGTLSEDEWQPTGPFGRLITEWPLPTNSSS